MHNAEVCDLPGYRVAAVAHAGAHNRIGSAFERLGRILAAARALDQTRGMIAIYHDHGDGTPPAALRSHAGAIWANGKPLPEGLEELHLPAGRYAVLHYSGPYDGLTRAWSRIYTEWAPTVGAVLRAEAPAYELYLNSPADTAPEALRTDLCMPIE